MDDEDSLPNRIHPLYPTHITPAIDDPLNSHATYPSPGSMAVDCGYPDIDNSYTSGYLTSGLSQYSTGNFALPVVSQLIKVRI